MQPEIILIGCLSRRSVSYFKEAEGSKPGCCVRLSFPLLSLSFLPPPESLILRLACKRLLFLAFNSALSRIHKHQKHFQLMPISKLSQQFTKTIFQLLQIELVMDLYRYTAATAYLFHFVFCINDYNNYCMDQIKSSKYIL